MKKTLKAIFSFAAVGLLVIAGIVYLSDLTERKESNNKFSEFYEQEEDYDVLFLGSSHVLNSVFPMELWNDYGIVSYNLAGYGSRSASNYWVLKNALEYTTPKLVVVDCCMISLEEKVGSVSLLLPEWLQQFEIQLLFPANIEMQNHFVAVHSNDYDR